jgi:hypothetical protein
VNCICRSVGIGDDQSFITKGDWYWMMQTHKLLILTPLRDGLPRYLPRIVSSVTNVRATLLQTHAPLYLKDVAVKRCRVQSAMACPRCRAR